jgi:hypothetical protein
MGGEEKLVGVAGSMELPSLSVWLTIRGLFPR